MGASKKEPAVHEPVRMCVICRERHPKRELARYVCPRSGRGGAPLGESGSDGLIPDPDQVLPGRGFYICGKADCRMKFEKAQVGLKKKCKGETL